MSGIDRRPLAIAIMGPTASGKTQAALALADRLACALISVDSALVYRGMNIGTAKPDADTLRRYPHALVDIVDPEQVYSAADFARDARQAIDQALIQGRMPVLVGGTGLYFRALTEGLSELPESDPAVKRQLATELSERGLPALHAELNRLDPAAGARIHANDPQRILRALEVIRLSGMPLSALQGRRRAQLPVRLLKLIVCPADRSLLHERIAARFQTMATAGLIEEVTALRARPDVHAELPAMRAVGYRQTWQMLDGEFDRGEWLNRGIFATRQLAKRQITWLRSEYDAFWLDSGRSEFQDGFQARIVAAGASARSSFPAELA